jgi:hypothetical protein
MENQYELIIFLVARDNREIIKMRTRLGPDVAVDGWKSRFVFMRSQVQF